MAQCSFKFFYVLNFVDKKGNVFIFLFLFLYIFYEVAVGFNGIKGVIFFVDIEDLDRWVTFFYFIHQLKEDVTLAYATLAYKHFYQVGADIGLYLFKVTVAREIGRAHV